MKLTTKVLIGGVLFIVGAFWFSFSYFPGDSAPPVAKTSFKSQWFDDGGVDVVMLWNPTLSKRYRSSLRQTANQDNAKIQDQHLYVPSNVARTDFTRFVVRSIEQSQIEWVRKVHLIVPDGAVPDGFKLPELNLVPYSYLLPKEYLPTFNEQAIIWNLLKIPELTKKFIYVPMGTFLSDNFSPEELVDDKGKLVIEVRKHLKLKSHYESAVGISQHLVLENKKNVSFEMFGPVLYDTQILKEVSNRYSKGVLSTTASKWESPKTLITSVVYRGHIMAQSSSDSEKYGYIIKPSNGWLVQWPGNKYDVTKALDRVKKAHKMWFWIAPRVLGARDPYTRKSLDSFLTSTYPIQSTLEIPAADYERIGLYLGLAFILSFISFFYTCSAFMGVKRSKRERFST